MKLLKIEKLKSGAKKYKATFDDGTTTSFGAKGYRDFTLLNKKGSKFYIPKMEDREKVRLAYLKRHRKNENWNVPKSAGSLSRYILWNKTTLTASIRDFKQRFKLG